MARPDDQPVRTGHASTGTGRVYIRPRTSGVIHILVTGEPPEHRLAQQARQAVAAILAGACIGEHLTMILDARYKRARKAGVILSQAVLIVIGIYWDGRRQMLAVELANRESRSSWRDFLVALKARGLNGVEFVVADDHAGLRAALGEVLRRRPTSAAMCTLAQRPRLRAAPGRRRLPAGAALAV